jgi:HEAT repeat protein
MDQHAREPEILEELESPVTTRAQRRALLSELRGIATEQSLPTLRRQLQRADSQCQARAIFAIADIEGDDATEALGECIATTRGMCFTFAARELGRRGGVRARELLTVTLREREELDSSHKRVLISALSRMPHRSAIPVLAPMLNDPSLRTRSAAATVLGRIRDPDSRVALSEAADSLSWWRGGAARRALRRMRTS